MASLDYHLNLVNSTLRLFTFQKTLLVSTSNNFVAKIVAILPMVYPLPGCRTSIPSKAIKLHGITVVAFFNGFKGPAILGR